MPVETILTFRVLVTSLILVQRQRDKRKKQRALRGKVIY